MGRERGKVDVDAKKSLSSTVRRKRPSFGAAQDSMRTSTLSTVLPLQIILAQGLSYLSNLNEVRNGSMRNVSLTHPPFRLGRQERGNFKTSFLSCCKEITTSPSSLFLPSCDVRPLRWGKGKAEAARKKKLWEPSYRPKMGGGN